MPSHRTAQSIVLPLPRYTPIYFGVLWVLTFAFGFAISAVPGALSAQLGLDRALNNANSSVLDAAAKAFDKLDSVPVVAVFIVVLVVAVGLSSSWWRAIAAAAVAGGGWVLCLVPKAIIAEPRPPAGSVAHAIVGSEATLSYPSGHVVFAVTFTIAVVLVARRGLVRAIAIVLGTLFVLATMWARLYVGAHYPTDVIGSVLAGLAGALTVAWLWNLIAPPVIRRITRRPNTDAAPADDAPQASVPSP